MPLEDKIKAESYSRFNKLFERAKKIKSNLFDFDYGSSSYWKLAGLYNNLMVSKSKNFEGESSNLPGYYLSKCPEDLVYVLMNPSN